MEPTVDKIILLPRFTSFAGSGTFLTAPMNVRAYHEALIQFDVVATLGTTGPTISACVQESPDLEYWQDIGPALTHNDSVPKAFRFEWIRLKVTVSGADPGFTGWCVGNFVRRMSS